MCAMFSTLSHVLHMSASDNAISQHADPLDLELDDVAPLQPAPVAVLEDAAGADRAGAEDVAGAEVRVPGRLREDRVPGMVHVRELAARTFLAVDAGDHRPGCPVELVGRDDDRPEARREVLALGRPESDAHLRPLEVARGPVVHDGEAADPALGTDDRSHLELIVELPRARWVRDVVPRSVDRGRVREVEDRDLVPLLRHLLAARAPSRAHVLLERVEVAYGRWVEDGRPKVDVGERILGMAARVPAAGEERLQRLRRELVDDAVLDQPRPAALEREVARCEHAEPHRYGSVCTITSAISGRSRRIRSSISLARACASASAVPGSRPRVKYASSPSSVRRKRSSRGRRPVVSWTIRSTSARSAPTSSTSRPSPASDNGSRWVCTESTSGAASTIARSTAVATSCASSSRRSPGNFRWSETSVQPSTSSTLTLCTSRTPATPSSAACARSRIAASSSFGSTWTTTSLPGSAACTASSTWSAAAWPWPTAAPGEMVITTSAN